LNMKKCMSYALQTENLSDAVGAVMQNRVADCEICQEACPWNARHIKRPLKTALTTSFQNQIDAWEELFHLPALNDLTPAEYANRLGSLSTDIPFEIFHRNVTIALQRAKNTPR